MAVCPCGDICLQRDGKTEISKQFLFIFILETESQVGCERPRTSGLLPPPPECGIQGICCHTTLLWCWGLEQGFMHAKRVSDQLNHTPVLRGGKPNVFWT